MSGILQLVNTFPSGGFAVKNSLRFRSSASAYLNRTPSVAGNRRTWTYSFWTKITVSSQFSWFLIGGLASTSTDCSFCLTDSANGHQLQFYDRPNGPTVLNTTATFRDPSAWYHIVLAYDSTQATASNRIKLYVNGVQITSFTTATYPALNTQTNINNSVSQRIATRDDGNTGSFYMADINFIDGQALTPSSFGAFDATSGVWQPVKYSGTYGTNGFYLKFSDTTSTTTLCYDYSGNSNNWTPNNISLTAGSTYDSMLDSPTNYDNGGNGVGNYAVLNPLKVGSSLTLSNANLTVAASGSGIQSQAFSSIAQTSGKFYFEVTVTTNTNANAHFGVATPLASQNTYAGQDANSWGFEPFAAIYYLYINGVQTGPVAYAGMTATGVFGVAVDVDAGKMWITDQTGTYITGNPATGTSALISSITNTNGLLASVGHYSVGAQTTLQSANFGQRPFAYPPPTGYKALNTQNLSAPSIVNGASYMAATTYTGNGTTQSISNAVNGVSFQPDLVWVKSRSNVSQNELVDSVRGANGAVMRTLFSNQTAAEQSLNTDTDLTFGLISSLNSSGFTVNTGATNAGQTNFSGYTYVGWQWKAGGTAVTNTAGSITSQVSANTTAGFSVVTFTSQASGTGTFGHGLGAAPSMVIKKIRNTNGTSWAVYHSSLTSAAYYLELNTTIAQTANSGVWNSTAPTSSVVSLGTGNAGSYPNVAYCFAAIPGYSAFGSYTGNGSADGPFVYCGFRPRFVLFKNVSDGTVNWFIFDSSRNTYNVVNSALNPNSTSTETVNTAFNVDLLSNGFKLRNTNNSQNTSGNVYIYAAFAENPLKYSLAR